MCHSSSVRFFARIFLISILVVAVSSCSGRAHRYDHAQPARGGGVAERPIIPSSDQGERMPWEVWALGRDLNGEPLRDRVLLQADELVRRGDRDQGLKIYRSIDQRRLTPAERDALQLHLASVELSQDQPRDALTTLSTYFRALGRSESDVDARFSLIFAYAYGRLGDFDQSLAWFSRVRRMDGAAGLRESTALGVRLLLRAAEDDPLYQLSKDWRSDSFIEPLIGQERRRRAEPGYTRTDARYPFWTPTGPTSSPGSATSLAAAGSGDRSVVGAILPLSGPFAALGKGAKQGIELAVEGHSQDGTALEVRDDGGDAVRSVAVARELVGAGNASVILGPLLTEPALRVSEVLRIERRPMVAFAKSGNFPPGGGVFRLGPTAQSQAASLVSATNRAYGYTRFAMVYPRDASGEEFAQAFRQQAQALGMQLVYENSYAREDLASMLTIAKELEEKAPQAVFLPDSLKAAANFCSYLTGGAGTKIRPLGTASWDNSAELQQSRAVLDGAVFVSPFYRGSAKPEIAKFVESYRARYGSEPDFLAAQAFDAATLALEALKQAKDQNTQLEQAFSDLGMYQGLTGNISVRADGEMERQFAVLSFDHGVLGELSENKAPDLIEDSAGTATNALVPSASKWVSNGTSAPGESR